MEIVWSMNIGCRVTKATENCIGQGAIVCLAALLPKNHIGKRTVEHIHFHNRIGEADNGELIIRAAGVLEDQEFHILRQFVRLFGNKLFGIVGFQLRYFESFVF